MLSYRHAFHAGNHADVLKHTLLLHCLDYLQQKDKPLRIVDTHSGAGLYKLTSNQAKQTGEFLEGVGRLWALAQAPDGQAFPAPLARYLACVSACNPSGQLTRYPGSPLLVQQSLRDKDRLFLHELHPADVQHLKEAVASDKRVKVVQDDGLAGMQALLPPPDKRGLVLIDPSYEIKSDYQQVVKQLQQAHKRFATGTYALWYPVVSRGRISEMEKSLQKSGIRNIQLYELAVRPDAPEQGMTASGMIVINPPWTLWKAMEETLPWLAEQLGGATGAYRIEQLVAE